MREERPAVSQSRPARSERPTAPRSDRPESHGDRTAARGERLVPRPERSDVAAKRTDSPSKRSDDTAKRIDNSSKRAVNPSKRTDAAAKRSDAPAQRKLRDSQAQPSQRGEDYSCVPLQVEQDHLSSKKSFAPESATKVLGMAFDFLSPTSDASFRIRGIIAAALLVIALVAFLAGLPASLQLNDLQQTVAQQQEQYDQIAQENEQNQAVIDRREKALEAYQG